MSSSDSGKMPESYIPPNVEPKCSWSLDKKPEDSPHHHVPKKLAFFPFCTIRKRTYDLVRPDDTWPCPHNDASTIVKGVCVCCKFYCNDRRS